MRTLFGKPFDTSVVSEWIFIDFDRFSTPVLPRPYLGSTSPGGRLRGVGFWAPEAILRLRSNQFCVQL